MKRRLFILLLALAMILSLAAPAFAAESDRAVKADILISSPEELIAFADQSRKGSYGNGEGLTVKLGADIDMTGYDWYLRGVDGNVMTDHRIREFAGTIDGQGHTIRNLNFRDAYSGKSKTVDLAFIIQGKCVLKDLHIDGITVESHAPAYFAGLVKDYAWSGADSAYAEGCSVRNVVIDSYSDLSFGGMFYRMADGQHITDCHVENFTVNARGPLVGDNGGRNGGFAATGGDMMEIIRCSVTNLQINTESTGQTLGGFMGGVSMTAAFYNCAVTNFDLNAKHDFETVGGFLGFTAGAANENGLVVSECSVSDLAAVTEQGKIQAAGGFIGYTHGQGKSLTNGAHHFENCTADGFFATGLESTTGGFVGNLQGRSGGCAANFVNCSTSVSIYSGGQGGAFVGNFLAGSGNVMYTSYVNCRASGDVTAKEPNGSFMDSDPETNDGIVGGTYTYDPQDGFISDVAEGYYARDNGNGTWTVVSFASRVDDAEETAWYE